VCGFLLAVGVDIVEVSRIKRAVLRSKRFLHRVFSESEQAYCLSKRDPFPSLAVRWAGKEAFCKLHPRLSGQVRLREIEILAGDKGRPRMRLYGRTAQAVQEIGLSDIDVSLSHAGDNAIAVVVASIR